MVDENNRTLTHRDRDTVSKRVKRNRKIFLIININLLYTAEAVFHTSDTTTGCLMIYPKRSELVKHSDVADSNVVLEALRLIKRAGEERAKSTNLNPHAPTEISVGGS